MSRKTVKEIVIKANLRCKKIYPVESNTKKMSDLKSIGIRLNKNQAIDLSRALLAASQDWDDMELTGYRLKKRSDNTYQLTLTTYDQD